MATDEIQTILHNLDLVSFGNYTENVKLFESNICDGKQACFQYSHSHTSPRTPEALKLCRSVMIAAYTHTHTAIWWWCCGLVCVALSDRICSCGIWPFSRKGQSGRDMQGDLWRAGEGTLWQEPPLLRQTNSLSWTLSPFPHHLFLSTFPILSFLWHNTYNLDHSCFLLSVSFLFTDFCVLLSASSSLTFHHIPAACSLWEFM